MAQGAKQEKYLEFKMKLFENHDLTVKRLTTRISKTTFADASVMHFASVKIPGLRSLSTDLYDMVNNLTPLGLMLWWCDDGTLLTRRVPGKTSVSRFGYLCTESLSDENQILVADTLRAKYGLILGVHSYVSGHTKKKYTRLYFNAVTMRQLIDTVRPHIGSLPPTMLYKFNMKYDVKSKLPHGVDFNDYNF